MLLIMYLDCFKTQFKEFLGKLLSCLIQVNLSSSAAYKNLPSTESATAESW